MPRDSSGNMTLAKAAFVAGTTIVAADVNADLEDIRAEIQDSLSRSGKGGLLAALRFGDGSVSAPSQAFTNETGTGIYRPGTNLWGVSVAGTQRFRATSTGAVVTGTFNASGDTTVGGTLGVTGATTLTGGVAGDTTFSANVTVQGSTGVTLTTGDLVMSEAAGQVVTKSGGSLTVGTSDANDVVINRAGAAALTFGSSAPTFAGKPTASATASGDGSTTLTTKGYVESLTDGYSGNAWASGGSWGTNWSNNGANVTRIYKQVNGVVVMRVSASNSGSPGSTAFTLPTGYRPAYAHAGLAFINSTGAVIGVLISTAGAVSIASGSFTGSVTYEFVATFATT